MRFLTLLLAVLAFGVSASAFPTKPVRVIVAFSPGGVTDIIARTLMPKLAELWGQPVVVENRAGAGGSLAAVVVTSAAADGSVLLVHSSGYAINAAINPSLPYDPHKDFIAVAHMGSQPQVLVVNPASPYMSVRDLIAAAKAKPGEITYGSAGIGSGGHFNAELFRIAAGIEAVARSLQGRRGRDQRHGSRAAQLHLQHGHARRCLHPRRPLRVLGVSSAQRSSLLPDVPTIAEAAFPGSSSRSGTACGRRPARRAAIAEKIARDLAQVVAAPDVRERFARLGAEPMGMTPAEFSKFVRGEIDSAERIARISGIKAQ